MEMQKRPRCRGAARAKVVALAGLTAALALASATFLFTGCSNQEAVTASSSEVNIVTSEPAKPGTTSQEAFEGLTIPDEVQQVVAGIGWLDELPSVLQKQQSESAAILKQYQKVVIEAQGLEDTGVKGVFGHTIYSKGNNFVYVWSGDELLESQAQVDIGDPEDALFNTGKFDSVFGRDTGGVKMENGKVRAVTGISWVEAIDDESKVEKVMINNQTVSNVFDRNLIKDGYLKLSALSSDLATLEQAREWVANNNCDKMVVKDTAYSMISVTPDIRVGFDWENSFIVFAPKMFMNHQMGINEATEEDQFEVDTEAYLSVLKGGFCKEMGIDGGHYDFGLLEAKLATNAEDMFDGTAVLNPVEKKIEVLETMKADAEGNLYIDLDTFVKTSDAKLLYSSDGTILNIITDASWNQEDGEAANGVSEQYVQSTPEAKESLNYVTVLKEEAAKAQQEKDEATRAAAEEAARQKAQQEAAAKAEQEKQAQAKEQAGASASQGTTGGATENGGIHADDGLPGSVGGDASSSQNQGQSGGKTGRDTWKGQPEPSGTPGNKLLRGNETWDSSLGGWTYEESYGTVIIWPNGNMADLD